VYTWGPQISQSQRWPKQWIPFHRWAGGIQSGYAYTGIGTLQLWPDRVVLLVLFQVLWESKEFLWMPLSSKIRNLPYKMKIFLPYLVSEVTPSISVCVVSHVFSQLELHKQTTEDWSCPIHSCKAHWTQGFFFEIQQGSLDRWGVVMVGSRTWFLFPAKNSWSSVSLLSQVGICL